MVEVLIGHLVNQFTVMVGQTGLVFLCMLWVFQVPCLGSITLSVFMTLLQGLCGMSIGEIHSELFLISSSNLIAIFYGLRSAGFMFMR